LEQIQSLDAGLKSWMERDGAVRLSVVPQPELTLAPAASSGQVAVPDDTQVPDPMADTLSVENNKESNKESNNESA
jgi:hypothetical protein